MNDTNLESQSKSTNIPTLWIVLGALGMFLAHYLVFIYAPMESTMRAAQRIFYFHLPSAWLCYIGFILCAGWSLRYLMTQNPKHDALALASAEVGLLWCDCFNYWAFVGAQQGVWWKWEPRLTTMAILFLIFTCYWVIRSFGGDNSGVRRFGAVLAVLGAPNIFFVHVAVTRWRGDHPNNIGLEPEMRVVLYSCLLIFIIIFTLLIRLRYGYTEERTVSALSRRLSRIGG